MRECRLFIGGEWRGSSDGGVFESLDPATGRAVARCHRPTEGDVALAVAAARRAFDGGAWGGAGAGERAGVLEAAARGIRARAEELVEWEVLDSGSTVRKARADVRNAAGFLKATARAARSFAFERRDGGASREGLSENFRLYEPVGVCAQIVPWNFPLLMAAWKAGPVVATGCASVLKSAAETPVTATVLAEVLQEAGLPDGVLNVITGDAAVGRALVSARGIDKVAFTGSTEAGRDVLARAAGGVLRTTLELGGKSANVVFADADMDAAVDGALYAFLYHAGQACDSGTRILVEDAAAGEFAERLAARARDVPVGPPSDPGTGLGPLVGKRQFERVMGHVEKARREGARLLFGGGRRTEGDLALGHYVEPTVFEIGPSHSMFREEVFGPVAGLTRFSSEEEAVALANDSPYGLAGAVWTGDAARARRVAGRMRAGTVWINEYHLLNPGMPFGGYKLSGLGRELGEEGLLAYLEVKHLWESRCPARKDKPWLDAVF